MARQNRRTRFQTLFHRTTLSLDIPFGYTLSVWGAGFLSANRYGAPQIADVFSFIFGAMAGYLVCFAIPSPEPDPRPFTAHQAVVLNLAPAIAALTVVLISPLLPVSWLGYTVSGFLATTIYVAALSILVAAAERFLS